MSKGTPRYLIDTSVFIQAYRAYYSFKLCPGFWTSILTLHKQGLVFSIDRVFDEVCYGDEDELHVWAKKTAPKEFFSDTTAIDVVKWYAQLQQWANGQPQFHPSAKQEFADEADAWLIAYAGAKNYTVVTQEVFSVDVRRRIPIPNVCKCSEFRIPVVDVFTMLLRLNVQFDWNPLGTA
jgi:hypothetical protein